MATERLTGAPLPSDSDDPNNFGGLMQATLEAIAEFAVPSFADAGERDTVWVNPGPHNGAKCWLDSPAGFYSKWPAGWRPDAMPGAGDSTTVVRGVIADSDVVFVTPDMVDFGCGTTIAVPSWARLYGADMQLSAEVLVKLNGGATPGAAFSLIMRWSTDGGSTWQSSTHIICRGDDVIFGIPVTATDYPATIDVEGVSNVVCRITVVARISSDGTLERVASMSRVVWTATFTPAA